MLYEVTYQNEKFCSGKTRKLLLFRTETSDNLQQQTPANKKVTRLNLICQIFLDS